MAVGEEATDLPAFDEAELSRRRAALRKFPRNRALSDEQLNEMILVAQKRAGKRRRGATTVRATGSASTAAARDSLPVNPEEFLPASWRPEYRKIVKAIIDSVKDDVNIAPLRQVIENLALKILLERMATMEGASLRDLKDLSTAIQTALTNLGLTEPRRHIANKRSEDSLQDALSLSQANVGRARGARTVGRERMKALLDAKPNAAEGEGPDGES